MAIRTVWIQQFKGVNDTASPGASPVTTNDLSNVKVLHGQIKPRAGLTNYNAISSASSADIIGLFSYPRQSGTNALLRMLPTKIELLGASSWSDITGTALTGGQTTRPQATIIDDTLILTNEGEDLPRKYTGSGNTASIAGGTSPYGKTVSQYLGFLMIGNVSDNGSFTDVFDGLRIIRYSDDWDNDWTHCSTTEIVLHETPGALLKMLTLGRDLMCYKEDGLVRVTWVGGNVIFKHEKVDFNIGFISPLAIWAINEDTHLALGNDGVLYSITSNDVSPVSFDQLYKTIPPTISLAKLKYAVGIDNNEEAISYLFYDRTGLSNQLKDSYVAYGYREKSFVKGRLGKSVISATSHKPTSSSPIDLIVSTATLVDEFDSGVTDDGTSITSYWTTGPQKQEEEGWLIGTRLIFDKPSGKNAHIEVSVASDGSNSFTFPEVFRLIGGDPSDDFVEVSYRPPAIYGNYFNIKVRFKSTSLDAGVELRRVGLEINTISPIRRRPTREGHALSL